MNNSPKLHSYTGGAYPDIYAFRRGMSMVTLDMQSDHVTYDAGYCIDALDVAPAGSVLLLPTNSGDPVIRNSTAWIR